MSSSTVCEKVVEVEPYGLQTEVLSRMPRTPAQRFRIESPEEVSSLFCTTEIVGLLILPLRGQHPGRGRPFAIIPWNTTLADIAVCARHRQNLLYSVYIECRLMGLKILQFFVFILLMLASAFLPHAWTYTVTVFIAPFTLGLLLPLAARLLSIVNGIPLFFHMTVITGIPAAGYVVSLWRGGNSLQRAVQWVEENIWTALQSAIPVVVFVVCLVLPASICYFLGLFVGCIVFGGPADERPPEPTDERQ